MFDVAIVGAGPAGSSAARLLATWGHRVVLVHRSDAGTSLAESIPPSCRKLFSVIGALDRIDAAGFCRSGGNVVWWESDEPRTEMFPDGERGYQVERRVFDQLLRGLAVEAGADLRPGLVREVHVVNQQGSIVLDDGSTIPTSFVLDCSGRAGILARRGWRIELTEFPRTVALVARWRGPDVAETAIRPDTFTKGVRPQAFTLVEAYADGWGWSVPTAADVRYITAMVDPQRTELARGRSALDVYRAELGKTRHLAKLAEAAALEGGPWGFDASIYVARQYASAPLLLAGDAGSFIDPLTSFGIKKALASAWLAAVAVHTALRTPAMTAAALDFFSARETEVATTLIEQTRAFFGDAASRHAHPFWSDRAATLDVPPGSQCDVRELRDDPRVRRAFELLKSQSSIRLSRGERLRIDPRPIVRGHEIVLEDRLFCESMPGGVRYLRDVDLAALLSLAPDYTQVPDLFDAYNRRFPPVALPDFLGALSVMLAFGMLDDSRASAG